MDMQRLEKLVRLAGSDNDHEALLALRQAQKMTKGNLWETLQKTPGASRSGSSRDEMRVRELERLLTIAESQIKNLEETIRRSAFGRTSNAQPLNLPRYLKKPGFSAIHYEIMLEDWIKNEGISPSKKDSDWTSVADLKELFEKSLGRTFKDSPSIKRFSQAFSLAMGGIKPIKGGAKRDLMGYRIVMW